MEKAVELYLGIDLARLLELLKVGSLTKATGLFSWQAPYREEGIRVLLLTKVRRLGKDSVECRIDELRYRKPEHIVIAGRKHVITLNATRVKEGLTYVLLRCKDPNAQDTSFAHFVREMVKLGERLAGPDDAGETAGQVNTEVGELQQQQVPAGEEPWMSIPDLGWDRLAVRLAHEGYSSSEIARRIGRNIVAKTVDNRLSSLRAIYGEQIVPYRKPGAGKPG